MNDGWIKICKGIREHWLWTDARYLQWWIDLLLMANWKDGEVVAGSKIIVVKRGELVTSWKSLSERWGVGMQVVRTYIGLLESQQMVSRESNNHLTKITICNYDKYQDAKQTNNKPITNTQQTDNKPITTIEEYKEIKEIKNNPDINSLCSLISVPSGTKITEQIAKMIPPPLAYVKEYCRQRGNGIDAEAFYNFYESKGWMIGKSKMKKWTSAIVTWEKTKKQENGRERKNDSGDNGISQQLAFSILAELGDGELPPDR